MWCPQQVILPASHACKTLGDKYDKARFSMPDAARPSADLASNATTAQGSRSSSVRAFATRASTPVWGLQSSKHALSRSAHPSQGLRSASQTPRHTQSHRSTAEDLPQQQQQQEEEQSSAWGKKQQSKGSRWFEKYAYYPDALVVNVESLVVGIPGDPQALQRMRLFLQQGGRECPRWMLKSEECEDLVISSCDVLRMHGKPPQQQQQQQKDFAPASESAAAGVGVGGGAAAAAASAGQRAGQRSSQKQEQQQQGGGGGRGAEGHQRPVGITRHARVGRQAQVAQAQPFQPEQGPRRFLRGHSVSQEMGMVRVSERGPIRAAAGAKRPRAVAAVGTLSTRQQQQQQLGAIGDDEQVEVSQDSTWGKRAKRKLTRALQKVLPRFKRVDPAAQQAGVGQGAAGGPAAVPSAGDAAGGGGAGEPGGAPGFKSANAEQAGLWQEGQGSGSSGQRPKAAVLVHFEGIEGLTGAMVRGNPMPCKVWNKVSAWCCCDVHLLESIYLCYSIRCIEGMQCL